MAAVQIHSLTKSTTSKTGFVSYEEMRWIDSFVTGQFVISSDKSLCTQLDLQDSTSPAVTFCKDETL